MRVLWDNNIALELSSSWTQLQFMFHLPERHESIFERKKLSTQERQSVQ